MSRDIEPDVDQPARPKHNAHEQPIHTTEGVQARGGPSHRLAHQAHSQLGNQVVAAALAGELGAFGDTLTADLGAEALGLPPAYADSNAAMAAALHGDSLLRDARAGGSVPDASQIAALIGRSRGLPLPAAVASRLGNALGHDVSGVQVHADPAAHQAAEAVAANAFAVGRHLFFRQGAFQPGTAQGDELLAHELVHVQQHDLGQLPKGAGLQVSSPSDPAEREAAHLAHTAVASMDSGADIDPWVGDGALGAGQMGPEPVGGAGPTLGAGPVMRSWLGDAAGWVGDKADAVGDAVGGSIIGLVRSVSPELADLLEQGIGGLAADVIGDALDGFLSSILGDVDLAAAMGRLTEEVQGFFAVIQGVLAGDQACCETFDVWMQSLADVATKLFDHPLVAMIVDVMDSIGAVVGDLVAVLAGAQLQALLTLVDGAAGAWNEAMDLIGAASDAVKSMGDWVWDGVCSLLGIEPGEGNIVDTLMAQASAWLGEQLQAEGPDLLAGLQQVGRVALQLTGIGLILDVFDLLKAVWEGASFLWDNWGSETLVEDAEQSSTMLGAFASGLEDADAKATEFGGWASEFFPTALGSIQESLDGAGLGWLGDGLRLLATPLLLPLQLGTAFATWFSSGGQETMTQWGQAAWDYVSPISDVLLAIPMAIAFPPGIPLMLAGWAWRAMPDCLKPPIVDLLFDVILRALVEMPEIPGLNGLFSLIKPGLIGALSEFRNRSDKEKIDITNKVAKLLTGSPEFILGLVVGIGKGMLDGILDPLMLVWMAIKGVVWLVDQANTLTAGVRATEDAASSATAAADGATQAADAAADLANLPIALDPVDLEALQRAAGIEPSADAIGDPEVLAYLGQMGQELKPPAEVIGETFVPAFTEAFGSGDGSLGSMVEMLGSLWETMKQLVGKAGQYIGRKMCELLLSESGEYNLGYGTGYVIGVIAFEVLLAVVTSGAWVTLGPTARAIVKFLDLGGELLGAAFRALGQLGELLMKAVRPILDWLGNTGLMGTLKAAMVELANKLVKLSDDLLGMLGGKADNAAGAGRKVDDVGTGAAVRTGDGQVDDGLDIARRSVMAGDDVKLALAAKRIRPEPGSFDVVVHADGDRLLMLDGGAWRELSPAELAQRMRADGYDGGSVRLIACGSGQADGAAAKLSRELGADVKAPTDTAWIHPDGTITVGPRPDQPTGGWSHTSSDGATEVVEDSAKLSDDGLAQVDDAVAAGRRRRQGGGNGDHADSEAWRDAEVPSTVVHEGRTHRFDSHAPDSDEFARLSEDWLPSTGSMLDSSKVRRSRGIDRETLPPGTRTVRVYRAEVRTNQRIGMQDGQLTFHKSTGKSFKDQVGLNFDNEARAREFATMKLQQGQEVVIKSFEVPEGLLDRFGRDAVDEGARGANSGTIVRVDRRAGPNQFMVPRGGPLEDTLNYHIAGSLRVDTLVPDD